MSKFMGFFLSSNKISLTNLYLFFPVLYARRTFLLFLLSVSLFSSVPVPIPYTLDFLSFHLSLLTSFFNVSQDCFYIPFIMFSCISSFHLIRWQVYFYLVLLLTRTSFSHVRSPACVTLYFLS